MSFFSSHHTLGGRNIPHSPIKTAAQKQAGKLHYINNLRTCTRRWFRGLHCIIYHKTKTPGTTCTRHKTFDAMDEVRNRKRDLPSSTAAVANREKRRRRRSTQKRGNQARWAAAADRRISSTRVMNRSNYEEDGSEFFPFASSNSLGVFPSATLSYRWFPSSYPCILVGVLTVQDRSLCSVCLLFCVLV